ncbi:DUF4236 domain-containing protein [Clostridium estertheticum]|uniref:DUF4236 domain-containing protein n=1 Tax=Clostridium estertheticum TaxID=238834 RepID=UPI00124C47EF|nr:DUF4236 domain-containing protein [Clostridium estertheticum]MBZ9615269.1 DUF4236 domain-containing protein [Clostridium estertheticum subsp. laramiense]WAG75158.1 DUF4236 domain-containing protein [Clostridium estertheticum]
MGFRVKKSFGPKGFKINVGKKGISSVSLKIAPGLTINSKRGTTVGLPGTGISYNTGGKKKVRNVVSRKSVVQATNNVTAAEKQAIYQQRLTDMRAKTEIRKEYNRKFKEFTGGYNKKAIIAIIVSFVLCATPLWPLGLLLSIPLLTWLAIDTIIKIIKFNKHLKNLNGIQ